jgi:Protein of unknown function (DUF1353)
MAAEPPLDSAVLRVALLEAEQHQEALRNALSQINRLSMGTLVLTVLLAAPLVVLRDPLSQGRLVFLIVLLAASGSMLLHFTWTEFLNLVHYKYTVLYPRLFRLVGHGEWPSYLEMTAPRSLLHWLPALLSNVSGLGALLLLWSRFLLSSAVLDQDKRELLVLTVVSGLCLALLWISCSVVLLAARMLERDIKFALGRTYLLPTPFLSPLRIVPYGDGRQFVVAEAFKVRVLGSDEPLRVPAGSLTDLTSVPWLFWPLFPPWERYGPAAVVHDHLYSLTTGFTRSQSDRAFLALMAELGVGAIQRRLIYLAVAAFGGVAKRQAEKRRILTEDELRAVLQRFDASGEGRAI